MFPSLLRKQCLKLKKESSKINPKIKLQQSLVRKQNERMYVTAN